MFSPPEDFSACAAVTLRDARDDSVSDLRKIIMRLRANWGHAPARQHKRAPVDSKKRNSHLANHVGDFLEHREICRSSHKTPHVPIAGTSTASMLNGKVQVGILFSEENLAIHAMHMFSENSLLFQGLLKNPQEAWDAFRSGWLDICGPPKSFQMDEGGAGKKEAWADLRAERQITMQFQGV